MKVKLLTNYRTARLRYSSWASGWNVDGDKKCSLFLGIVSDVIKYKSVKALTKYAMIMIPIDQKMY